MLLSITHEVPMGHRLQAHRGKCRFLHGHNYLVKITLHGEVDESTGMIIDFSDLKALVREYFEPWDHALVLQHDDPVAELFYSRGVLGLYTKYIALEDPPTAEVLARTWAEGIAKLLSKKTCKNPLLKITVNETRDSEVSYAL